MHRRVVLAGIAAVVTLPAHAQNSDPSTARQPSAESGGAGGAAGSGLGTSRTGGQEMTQADTRHMQQTSQLGMVALEASRIAQQKAQNPELRRFATFELQEQTALSEVLRSMTEPATTAAISSDTQPQKNTPIEANALPTQMDAHGRETVLKLQNAQPGEAFDRQYLQNQMEGHSALLQVQTDYLQSNPQNREHMNVAKMARAVIVQHIALLEDIQAKMK